MTTTAIPVRTSATTRSSQDSAEQQLRALKAKYSLLGSEYNELLTHARAAVAADALGQLDAVGYVRDVLAENGQLPADGELPNQLLAWLRPRRPTDGEVT